MALYHPMKNLNFYLVDDDYVQLLKEAEIENRGFSRVPDMTYDLGRKPKFLCGIVLHVNSMEYYVPVSSFKQQNPDNFLILNEQGAPLSSLRFNYMFPVPADQLKVRIIKDEPDSSYRRLLNMELQYCKKNKERIQKTAERTYKRVLLGKNKGLVQNSCDFPLLEEKCREYQKTHDPQPEKPTPVKTVLEFCEKYERKNEPPERGSSPKKQ